METNDSNIRPQQTGGLKLMTVFIAVLALHVVVIGGFTVYHLMSGGGTDADALTDKTHKTVKPDDTSVSDGSLPDTNQNNATAANAPAPVADQTASTDNSSSQASAPVTTAANTVPQSRTQAPSGPVIDPPPVTSPNTTMAAAPEPAPAPAFEPAPIISGAPYVVKSHDSLARIAHRSHTSVAKLKAANGLTSDVIHIGQKLVIPARTQLASAQAPAAGQDASGSTTILGDTASTPSMTVPAAPAPTTAVAVHEQTTTAPSATEHHFYTVMKGDTLTKIARKFKTTPTAIMTANNITDPAKLSIGKKLKIPGLEARSANTTQAPAAAQPSQGQAKPATSAQLANYLQ